MESNDFDALVKRMARAHSRRTVLKSLGAAALGAMGLSRLHDAAAAPACRKAGHPCEGNQICCDGLACSASGPGSARRCAPCPDGTVLTNGQCVATVSCTDGVKNGDETDIDCGGSCDPCADGLSCHVNADCVSDSCLSGVCAAAPTCSDGLKNGSETDVDCGGICPSCADGQSCLSDNDCANSHCISGVCASCAAGQTRCGTVCVDTSGDPGNCGGCGMVCSGANATMICSSGVCAISSCNQGFADCDGVVASGCETDLSTVTNCGGCGTICPGYQQPNDNVTCQGGTCTFSCQGESYDVDGDPSNGCEVQSSLTMNHTPATALPLGAVSCFDNPPQSVNGVLPSDARVHANPAIAGFNVSTGSAPHWYVVHALGGSTCINDLSATLAIIGSAAQTCYELRVIAGGNTFIAQTTGSGMATITQGPGAYHAGDDIAFGIAKICGTSVTEAPSYTLTFHL